jgi:hypothetical protein
MGVSQNKTHWTVSTDYNMQKPYKNNYKLGVANGKHSDPYS